MKVTTDACLFGAWVPLDSSGPLRILDVGTGTGLLSLMLAQRNLEGVVDAIELDAEAASQATENVAASPFADRITVRQCDARLWMPDQKYDLVISNPPFFSDSLQSCNARRMDVRHSNTLAMDDLLSLARKSLKKDGMLAVLWPSIAYTKWAAAAHAKGFKEIYKLNVFPSSNAQQTRVATVWQHAEGNVQPNSMETLFIEEERGQYTDRFVELLAPFYLRLSAGESSAQ